MEQFGHAKFHPYYTDRILILYLFHDYAGLLLLVTHHDRLVLLYVIANYTHSCKL